MDKEVGATGSAVTISGAMKFRKLIADAIAVVAAGVIQNDSDTATPSTDPVTVTWSFVCWTVEIMYACMFSFYSSVHSHQKLMSGAPTAIMAEMLTVKKSEVPRSTKALAPGSSPKSNRYGGTAVFPSHKNIVLS